MACTVVTNGIGCSDKWHVVTTTCRLYYIVVQIASCYGHDALPCSTNGMPCQCRVYNRSTNFVLAKQKLFSAQPVHPETVDSMEASIVEQCFSGI